MVYQSSFELYFFWFSTYYTGNELWVMHVTFIAQIEEPEESETEINFNSKLPKTSISKCCHDNVKKTIAEVEQYSNRKRNNSFFN